MADNKTANAGSGGATFATDEISGVDFPRVKLIHGVDGTNDGDVASTNPFPVVEPNLVDTNNSTTSTLAGDATYTGTGTDVSAYASVAITLDASHDSSTNGMTFQFSTDNSNWDDVYTFTYTASQGARRFQFPVTAQYFRVVYTNGSTLQTHFRVQTILNRHNILTSIHRAEDDLSPDRSCQLVKAALTAQVNGSGDFKTIQANAAGVLKVGGSVDIDAGTNLIGRVAGSDETSTIYNATTALTPKFAIIDAATSGDNTLVAAVAAKKIRVLNALLVASAAVTARFEDGAGGTALTGQMQLAANGGFSTGYCPVGHFETGVNTLLNLELSGAISVDGWLVYVEV